MALLLVQHGKSLSKTEDPQQGLSREGFAETERIAAVAKGYQVSVSQIRHSGKARARQTAEIFAAALNPPEGIVESAGLNPLDDVTAAAASLDNRKNVMLVGHLPFMERLVSWLITASIDHPVFKFQNGGIVCLDQVPDTKSWIIKWTLMPHIG